jgi:hypothetical protein
MDDPNTALRRFPLAMDKWLSLVVSPRQTMLGLIVNTNTMTVGIPRSYHSECLDLLNNTWHAKRRQFTIKQAQQMVRKLARLAEEQTGYTTCCLMSYINRCCVSKGFQIHQLVQ